MRAENQTIPGRQGQVGIVHAKPFDPEAGILQGCCTAARVCANAPLPVRESLSVVNHEINGDEGAAWERSDAAHARLLGTDDVKEGIAAFFERRPAHWTGT